MAVALAQQRFVRRKKQLEAALEDGSLPFLSVVEALAGMHVLRVLRMPRIMAHVEQLAQWTHSQLAQLQHWNGVRVCQFYGAWNDEDGSLRKTVRCVSACLRRASVCH